MERKRKGREKKKRRKRRGGEEKKEREERRERKKKRDGEGRAEAKKGLDWQLEQQSIVYYLIHFLLCKIGVMLMTASEDCYGRIK